MTYDARTRRRRIGHLEDSVRKVQREVSKVSLQRFVASVLPFKSARDGLTARHAALVKMVDNDRAEIERLREGRG